MAFMATRKRQIPLTIEQWRLGAAAPTLNTIGTTPTIGVLEFTSSGNLISLYVPMPSDWDRSQDVELTLTWSLQFIETNGDSVDIALDYNAPKFTTASSGIDKANTGLLETLTVTTALGLAARTLYPLTFTLDANDATNPFADADGLSLEVRRANVGTLNQPEFAGASLEYVQA